MPDLNKKFESVKKTSTAWKGTHYLGPKSPKYKIVDIRAYCIESYKSEFLLLQHLKCL